MFGHTLAPAQRISDRHLHKFTHVQFGNLNRQRLGAQAESIAASAGLVVLIIFKLFAYPRALGLAISPLHIRNDTLKTAGYLINPASVIIPKFNLLIP